MKFNPNNPVHQEYATKLTLIGIFLSTFAAFVTGVSRKKGDLAKREVKPFDLFMLIFATFRLGRLVAFDQVMEPVRASITKTVPDESGAGDTVVARGQGVRKSFGQLVSCPICAGTWIASGLVYALQLFPHPTRIFLSMISAVGGAELLNAITEGMNWTGEKARAQLGEIDYKKEQRQENKQEERYARPSRTHQGVPDTHSRSGVHSNYKNKEPNEARRSIPDEAENLINSGGRYYVGKDH